MGLKHLKGWPKMLLPDNISMSKPIEKAFLNISIEFILQSITHLNHIHAQTHA